MTELTADAFLVVGPDDAIADRFVVPFYLSDRKLRISVARVSGQLYAFDDLCTCPGRSCPLSGGLLTGTTIMCQCHGSEFDITTGAVVSGPATQSLNVYEVQVVDGSIRIRPRPADDHAQRPGRPQNPETALTARKRE
jgi:3-phenylpropionate/trans-cinnamate dioxygenase ferredoxin component